MSQAGDGPIMPALSAADLNASINHEPRIMDLRLAKALAFKAPYRIRALIERHRASLERYGEVSTTVVKTSRRGGRPTKAFWLNKRQALFLCTKSETERATEATMLMVDVFDAYTAGEGALPPPGMKALPGPDAPKHKFMDLFTAACAAFNEWRKLGIVNDDDRAMYIALQAVFDVAGVDADVGRVVGLKRR